MYPHQPYSQPGGGTGAPYPQQSSYNMPGAQSQAQHSPFGIASGLGGGFPQNMSNPYNNNQGGYGAPGNPYNNPQTGNPYAQGGYGAPTGNPGSGAYPPTGQQQFGGNPYAPNPGTHGAGYPPSNMGGYPPSNMGGYPPSNMSGYPQQSGGYPSQPGAYPGSQPPYQPQGGYPGMGGGAGGLMPNDPRAQRLNQVVQQYEINQQFAARLQALANCEIVLLCDDSGSMNTPLQGTNQTRWDELKSLVTIVTDIAAVMDSNGVDIYFLNREPMLNVTNAQAVRSVFNYPPSGLTPLSATLRRILAAKRSQTFEKKLLILIATDGAPTNEHGQTDIGTFEAVLRNERTPQTYVTLLACTDDLEAVSYLSNWDKSMHNLDVMDDYRSEKTEIQRVRGTNFPFSFGDYIVKALLGSMDSWFDSLDERY